MQIDDWTKVEHNFCDRPGKRTYRKQKKIHTSVNSITLYLKNFSHIKCMDINLSVNQIREIAVQLCKHTNKK